MARGSLTLPNLLTIARIAACPAIFALTVTESISARFLAFLLFLIAALSDVWDGYLARKQGLVTNLGKFLDPLADKLLLVSTFVPFYLLSHCNGPVGSIPWWGELPMWVLLLVLGRELAVTLLRSVGAVRGVAIPADKAGKRKALFQSLFAGGLLLWYPLNMVALERGWEGVIWRWWSAFHGAWIGLTLWIALGLTVFSMGVYLWKYRAVLGLQGS